MFTGPSGPAPAGGVRVAVASRDAEMIGVDGAAALAVLLDPRIDPHVPGVATVDVTEAGGQVPGGAPKRSTMYVPISPAKNMISVERNNHKQSLPRPMGSAG